MNSEKAESVDNMTNTSFVILEGEEFDTRTDEARLNDSSENALRGQFNEEDWEEDETAPGTRRRRKAKRKRTLQFRME